MARQLADSLVEHKGLNESDLARRFTEEFYAEPHRGYGVVVVAGVAVVPNDIGDCASDIHTSDTPGITNT